MSLRFNCREFLLYAFSFCGLVIPISYAAVSCGGSKSSEIFEGTNEDGSVVEAGANEGDASDARLGVDISIALPPSDVAFDPRKDTVCGNKVLGDVEACDDGNLISGDGCSVTCQLEAGWACHVVGVACVAASCGDGIVAGVEECDDHNAVSSDGCSATCAVESGYVCPAAGGSCVPTVCGDGKKEGLEQCDDKNVIPYDGCSPTCTIDPSCTGGTCVPLCGDGLKLPEEECDDGNLRNKDGCSSSCTIEPGFTCVAQVSALPDLLYVPIIYRDFRSSKSNASLVNPDFEVYSGSEKGIPLGELDAQKKPVLAPGSHSTVTNSLSFSQWFRDVPDMNKTVYDTLKLRKQNDNTYLFNSVVHGIDDFGLKSDSTLHGGFFPLDKYERTGKTFGRQLREHNYHFTSEFRYWFTYQGGENLKFTGDDDVWVFINNKLAIDLGGIHVALDAEVTLASGGDTRFGLVPGKIYEMVLFQAERHTIESNYKLTLGGFEKAKSFCVSECGDGVVTPDELCDDGKANNTGAYGKCAPNCLSRGAGCGDGVLQADQGEECDDGNSSNLDSCSPSCKINGAH